MKTKIIVKKKNGLVVREANNQIIILDSKEGAVYRLNNTATRIWKLLYKKRVVSEVIRIIADDFGVSEKKIRGDVVNFIQMGIKNKLLQQFI